MRNYDRSYTVEEKEKLRGKEPCQIPWEDFKQSQRTRVLGQNFDMDTESWMQRGADYLTVLLRLYAIPMIYRETACNLVQGCGGFFLDE